MNDRTGCDLDTVLELLRLIGELRRIKDNYQNLVSEKHDAWRVAQDGWAAARAKVAELQAELAELRRAMVQR